jgi:hypothetical protein
MDGGPVPPFTDRDIRSLAAKLKGLYALLTPGEQMLLLAVLRRAAECGQAPAEVEGFAWAVSFNPFRYLDVIANELAGH